MTFIVQKNVPVMSIFYLNQIWYYTITTKEKNNIFRFKNITFTTLSCREIPRFVIIHLRCAALNKVLLSLHEFFRCFWTKFLEEVLQKSKCGRVAILSVIRNGIFVSICHVIGRTITTEFDLMSSMLFNLKYIIY